MTMDLGLVRYIYSLFDREKTYNFDIELCSPCNAKCTFCPQSTNGVKRSQSVMTKEQILTLVTQLDEIAKNAKIGIYFCGMGENLIRKDLILFFIENVKNIDKYSFTLVTNGHLLTEEFTTNPLLENLKIEISMSGWDSYESVYKLPAEKVRNKIIETAKLIGPRLKIHWVRDPNSIKDSEEKKFKEWHYKNIKKYKTKYTFGTLHTRGGTYLYPGWEKTGTRKFKKCKIFSDLHFISSDGDMLSCCHDIESKNVIDNINKNNILNLIEKKKLMQKTCGGFDICKTCNDFALTTQFKISFKDDTSTNIK